MPKINPVKKAIKEAKFVKALVQTSGNATEAYKAISGPITHDSARSLGSKELAKISHEDINALYEKIGCTKESVLTQLWERMKKAKDGDFNKSTSILSKIAGWETKSNGLRELLDRDLDLIEVVKIRLKKRNIANDLQQVIDVENTLPVDKSIDIATENTVSDEKAK